MITPSKLAIFKRCRGDLDMLSRTGRDSAPDFSDSEWTLLDQLIQRLVICQRGLAAESFRIEAFHDLESMAPEPEVRDGIMKMVEESM